MCLITTAGRGTKKDTEELYQWIRNGAYSNRDGSGFAFKRYKEEKVYLSKGYFEIEQMIDDIKKEKLGVRDELIIHHRSATSGMDKMKNTHPFVVDFDFENITMMQGFTDKPVVAHNGIFYNYGEKIDKAYNDTVHWIQIYLSNPHLLNLIKTNPQAFYDEGYADLTDLNYNKLAFIFPDIGLIHMGHYEKAEGGYYHSNGCYKNRAMSDRGGVQKNINFLDAKRDFNDSDNTQEQSCALKTVSTNSTTLFDNTNEHLGYSEIIRTVGENQEKYIQIIVDDRFLKLKESNLHLFNYVNPINGYHYFIDTETKGEQYPKLLNLIRWTDPKLDKVLITFEDLQKTYRRKVKAAYITLIRDIFELNKLYTNKPSKNRRKKLEKVLTKANIKGEENIKLDGTVRMVSPTAIQMYLDNHKPEETQPKLEFSETKIETSIV